MATLTTSTTPAARIQRSTVPIAFLSFIGLGLASGLLGLAWPSIRAQFGLALDGVNSLIIAQTATYTLASFFIGRAMTRFSSGTTLLVGVVLMTASLFGIAVAPGWIAILIFGLAFGLGNGTLDAGMNLYMTTYQTARQMNWLHASFGIGITIGPLIMTYAIASRFGWRAGYAIVGVLLIAVVILFTITRRAWRTEGFQTAEARPVNRARLTASIRLPAIWLGIATFIAYCGTEIAIGQWAYTLLTDARRIAPETAGLWVSLYWGAFTGGRILFGLIANRLPVSQLLRFAMIGMIIGAGLFWWNPINALGWVGLVIIGFAQAPVFPLLMFGTGTRVPAEHAENAVSLQMTAVGIGAALMPSAIGTIGKNYGLETMSAVFLIMAIVVFVLHELSLLRRPNTPSALEAIVEAGVEPVATELG